MPEEIKPPIPMPHLLFCHEVERAVGEGRLDYARVMSRMALNLAGERCPLDIGELMHYMSFDTTAISAYLLQKRLVDGVPLAFHERWLTLFSRWAESSEASAKPPRDA